MSRTAKCTIAAGCAEAAGRDAPPYSETNGRAWPPDAPRGPQAVHSAQKLRTFPRKAAGRDAPPYPETNGRAWPPDAPQWRRSGFSLLEALIALVIFGLVSAVLSQAFLNTLTALDTQAEIAATVDDLRFVRSQVILEADLETFEDGGEVETLDSGEARWEAEVEITKIPHLFQVFLTIEFEGSDTIEPWTHEETLYLLRPTWSDPADMDELMADLQEAIEDNRDAWTW